VTIVKVCGLRSLPEARAAVQAGANWLGFIFWKAGKRFVPPSQAADIIRSLRHELPASEWSAVGVFVDPSPSDVEEAVALCGLDYVQLSGDESAFVVDAMPRPTIKAIHVRAGQEAAAADVVSSNALRAHLYLLDSHAHGLHGGTGTAFDWAALQGVGPRCLVAGGLRPDNVALALATLAPLGVDVSSGVEFPQTPQFDLTSHDSRLTTPTNGGGKDPRLIQAFLEAVRSYDKRAE
jgi:phosphoribosylanthranilate isomerase